MQIINCTYRGSRPRYYVSKPYPYYITEELTVEAEALNGTLKDGLILVEPESVLISLAHLTSELRSLLQTYNISSGAIDGSIPATVGNVEAMTVQVSVQNGILKELVFGQEQPSEAATVSLEALDGTLLEVLIIQTQPSEAVFTNLTALNGTLV